MERMQLFVMPAELIKQMSRQMPKPPLSFVGSPPSDDKKVGSREREKLSSHSSRLSKQKSIESGGMAASQRQMITVRERQVMDLENFAD